ncbi:hypothetical protein JAAARDRAFT_304713 [Jaapia argillacea MUCL 33604]|uniref:Uncharacterized protein n=1 Tax=Jaapia argillacea MUCL 33604 TaxID=933084 RepID=A0A067PSU6_9AGAM|nr:hypothetical protein JAAARDRAFT_304713 [Jaapia argillacea MUCL 33604]
MHLSPSSFSLTNITPPQIMQTNTFTSGILTILTASITYFTLVFSCGFILGCIRVPLLVPKLGARYAELLEAPFMFIITIRLAHFINHKFNLRRTGAQLGVGVLALMYSFGAEYSVAKWLTEREGREWSFYAYLKSLDVIAGPVFGGLLLLYAVMPAILGSKQKVVTKNERKD